MYIPQFDNTKKNSIRLRDKYGAETSDSVMLVYLLHEVEDCPFDQLPDSWNEDLFYTESGKLIFETIQQMFNEQTPMSIENITKVMALKMFGNRKYSTYSFDNILLRAEDEFFSLLGSCLSNYADFTKYHAEQIHEEADTELRLLIADGLRLNYSMCLSSEINVGAIISQSEFDTTIGSEIFNVLLFLDDEGIPLTIENITDYLIDFKDYQDLYDDYHEYFKFLIGVLRIFQVPFLAYVIYNPLEFNPN